MAVEMNVGGPVTVTCRGSRHMPFFIPHCPKKTFYFLGISEVTGFINTKYSDPREDNPDVQLFFGGFLADCAKTGMVGEKLDNGSRTIQIIPTVLHPKSRGRLEITSDDVFDYPKIYAK